MVTNIWHSISFQKSFFWAAGFGAIAKSLVLNSSEWFESHPITFYDQQLYLGRTSPSGISARIYPYSLGLYIINTFVRFIV